jgi:hypothetical protein
MEDIARPNSNTGHIEEAREMLTLTPLRSMRWKDMAIKRIWKQEAGIISEILDR